MFNADLKMVTLSLSDPCPEEQVTKVRLSKMPRIFKKKP